MTYRTFEQDLPYLLGKFRNPSFDPATGLDNETIRRDIGLLARELAGEPRPVVKARAFEYVTRNVRIDVNPHDWFVGFGCWDRDDRPLTALRTYRRYGDLEGLRPLRAGLGGRL